MVFLACGRHCGADAGTSHKQGPCNCAANNLCLFGLVGMVKSSDGDDQVCVSVFNAAG